MAIPTYCRAEAVAANLAAIADEARRLGVKIFLSDDSPDVKTESIAKVYPDLVTYRRNSPAFRHDRNVLETLLWPDADYVWLLGDALAPRPEELEPILHFLTGQDMVFVNENSSNHAMLAWVEGEAARSLLIDKAWHQTLTGATIYHRRVLDWVRAEAVTIYPNFPQLSVILGFAAKNQPVLAWHGRRVLMLQPRKQSYWVDDAIAVFVGDWARLITGHAELFGRSRVAAVIRSHSRNANLFNPRFLATLRQRGKLNAETLRQPHFWDAMHLPRAAVFAIMAAPEPAAAVLTGLHTFSQRLTRLLRRLASGGKIRKGPEANKGDAHD